jgi:hypothetical protein
MKLFCFLFGHRPSFGYGRVEGEGYFTVKLAEIDGCGTQHARLFCDCERCGKNYQVGRIHITGAL